MNCANQNGHGPNILPFESNPGPQKMPCVNQDRQRLDSPPVIKAKISILILKPPGLNPGSLKMTVSIRMERDLPTCRVIDSSC